MPQAPTNFEAAGETYAIDAPKEETFTLRAQDMTADITVEFWADINRLLRQYLTQGYSHKDALLQIKKHLIPLKQSLYTHPLTEKVEQAYAIAKRMAQHQNRKVAD